MHAAESSMPSEPTPAPRSAYIHIPFCRHRCGYCNFSLVAGRDHLVDRFLSALSRELDRWHQADLTGRANDGRFELSTLFFGGGTPSHLSASALDRLARLIEQHFCLARDAEVTAECNPNDIDEAKIKSLAGMGVNRISLGVQSLNDDKLKQLERDHEAADVVRAVALARPAMQSVSLDLIFAAPGESLAEWERDLEGAIDCRPDHLSTYELTYEKGTSFWNRLHRGQLAIADEDLRADMYERTRTRLETAGWQPYEISSFARAGHRCRHNLAYWSGVDFLAFGPGAARFVGGVRSTNHASTMQYLQRLERGDDPVQHMECLTGIEAARERLVVGLRVIDGVHGQEFRQRTGISIEAALGERRDELFDHGLLEWSGDHCRLTRRGVMVSDGVAARILTT